MPIDELDSLSEAFRKLTEVVSSSAWSADEIISYITRPFKRNELTVEYDIHDQTLPDLTTDQRITFEKLLEV